MECNGNDDRKNCELELAPQAGHDVNIVASGLHAGALSMNAGRDTPSLNE
jgi:hypothetical protein